MRNKSILDVTKNAREAISCISGLVSDESASQLRGEFDRHVIGLVELAREHLLVAKSLPRSRWRHKVSRGYYCSYHAKRALRLYVSGHYSTDSSDHKKVSDLPDDFPSKESRKRRLNDLRTDRNTADYDHDANEDLLIIGVAESVVFSESFLSDVLEYLTRCGLEIGGGDE